MRDPACESGEPLGSDWVMPITQLASKIFDALSLTPDP